MPIYEYECNMCGKVTEALQKFSDSPLSDCPYCPGKLHKLMSLNSFHLKGSGWYVTDYARKNTAHKSAKGSSKEGSKTEKASDSKTSDTGTKNSKET